MQVHAVDASGEIDVRKALRRAQVLPFFLKLPPCLIGMEACGVALLGKQVGEAGSRGAPDAPAYVKPYAKRGKTDAADAGAIFEAVTSPSVRFVPVKSAEQQAALALLVKQRRQSSTWCGSCWPSSGSRWREACATRCRWQYDYRPAMPEVPALARGVVKGLAGQIGVFQIQRDALEQALLA